MISGSVLCLFGLILLLGVTRGLVDDDGVVVALSKFKIFLDFLLLLLAVVGVDTRFTSFSSTFCFADAADSNLVAKK